MRLTIWRTLFGMALGGAGAAHAQEARDEVRKEERALDRSVDKAADAASDAAFEVTHPKEAARRGELGEVRRGVVDNSVTTDPLAIISGSGINAQYWRPFVPKLSGVAGASFARIASGGGSLNDFGATVGLDWFAIGRDNEGLRIGPRVNVGVGRDTIGANKTYGSFGAAAEAGYNYIANSGLTAGLAGGLGFSTGNEPDETNLGTQRIEVSLDPYAKLNLGYSW